MTIFLELAEKGQLKPISPTMVLGFGNEEGTNKHFPTLQQKGAKRKRKSHESEEVVGVPLDGHSGSEQIRVK